VVNPSGWFYPFIVLQPRTAEIITCVTDDPLRPYFMLKFTLQAREKEREREKRKRNREEREKKRKKRERSEVMKKKRKKETSEVK
jgi:hypothetical protein